MSMHCTRRGGALAVLGSNRIGKGVAHPIWFDEK